MASLYTHKDSNVRKTWILMSVFLVVVIAVGWGFARAFGNSNILYIAVAFSLLMNFFSYWYSDKIVLRMSGAKRVERKDNPEIYRVLENLSITAGIKMPRLYIIEDRSPNAFATGRNEENAAVAVTTGLVGALDRSELEGVLAHELSHIGNRDILISTIVVVLVGFLALLSDFFIRFTIFGGGSRDRDGGGNMVMFLVGIGLAILAPIAALLIQLAISRKREFLADASGALLTRYPEGLARALQKISSNPNQLRHVSKATAHLYIASPFKGRSAKGRITKLFMTHPPVGERIAALREMGV